MEGIVPHPSMELNFINPVRCFTKPTAMREQLLTPARQATLASDNKSERGHTAAASHAQSTMPAAGAAVFAGFRCMVSSRRRRSKIPSPSTATGTSASTAEPAGVLPPKQTVEDAIERHLSRKGSLVEKIADLPKGPLLALNSAVMAPGLAIVAAAAVPQPLARVLSGALGTLGGLWVGKLLHRAKLDAASMSIGQILASSLPQEAGSIEEFQVKVDKARRRFDVAQGQSEAEVFEDTGLSNLYEVCLQAVVDMPEHDVADLPMLQRARAALCLDSILVGAVHHRVAQRLADRSDGSLSEDKTFRRAVDKLLFLSERMFVDDEPEEARLYEMSRIRQAVQVGPKEAVKRINLVACTLYDQALSRVAGQVSATTAATLTEHCEAFGMSDERALEMNVKTYCKIASDVLQEGTLTDAGRATLEKAQGVLQISDKAAHNAFLSVAGPKFQVEVEAVTSELRAQVQTSMAAVSDFEAPLKKMQSASAALGLNAADFAQESRSGFCNALRAIYSQACKAASANRDAEALKLVDEAIALAETTESMMSSIGGAGTEAQGVTISADPTAGGRLLTLYLERFLSGEAPDNAVPPEELISLLELPPAAVEEARVLTGEPRLKENFATLIKSLDDTEKQREVKLTVDAEVEKLNLPPEVVKDAALAAYKEALKKVENKILTQEEMERLERTMDALDVSPTDVRKLHLSAFGNVYERSVFEALGRGGAVPAANLEALEKLADRFFFMPEDAHAILLGVVQSRVNTMMESVREAWEETTYTKEALQQIWKERGKDVGDDPSADGTGGDMGIQAEVPVDNIRGYKLMVEFLKVTEFYTSCNILKEDADSIEELYPVTVGKALEQKHKEEMYGIFTWNAVTCQDTEVRDKWSEAKPHVGGVLGLSPKEQEQVLQRMVSRWCNMFIKQKVEENGQLGKEDINILTEWAPMFFGIGKDVTQDLVQAANKSMLQSKALRLLNKPKILPEDVEQLRKDVSLWDLQLKKDLELTKAQLRSLFRAEVVSILEDVDLECEQKQDAIGSSREGFGLSGDEAVEELGSLIQERCQGCLVNAVADLLQNNMQRAVAEMRRLSLLAEFAEAGGIEINTRWEMDLTMRRRLLDECEASALGAEDGQQPPNMSLLRQLLGITETA